MSVQTKRAYEPPAAGDGYRVLVDRLWPRGVRKEALELDVWLKQLAPSDELRRWYGHEVSRWPEFEQRYRAELGASGEAQSALDELAARARKGPVTLVFGAKDGAHANATVLEAMLRERSED